MIDYKAAVREDQPEGKGCGIMPRRQKEPNELFLPQTEPMLATFWRQGKFVKVPCRDCEVSVNEHYAEVLLRCEDPPQTLMFVISNDPDVEANMANGPGMTAAFDGFQLVNHDGATIERITVHDNRSLH